MEKQKRNNIILVVLLVILPLTVLTYLFFLERCSEEITWREEFPRAGYMMAKVSYARGRVFDFRLMEDGERLTESPSELGRMVFDRVDPLSPRFDPFYEDIVFVYTEEEALDFPDNIITAWPTAETLRQINGLNWALQDEELGRTNSGERIDVTDFSLEFPITLTDVIEDRVNVSNMKQRICTSASEYIRRGEAREAGNSPEFLAKLEQLTREKYSIDIPESTIPAYEIYLAIDFDFNFRMVAQDRIITEPVEILLRTQALYPKFFDPTYTELVFVETEAEAMQLPSNVVAAWPTEDTDFEEFLAELESLKEQREAESSE